MRVTMEGVAGAQEVEKVLELGPTVAAISKRSWRRRLRKATFATFAAGRCYAYLRQRVLLNSNSPLSEGRGQGEKEAP
jgi:hypothetical protein